MPSSLTAMSLASCMSSSLSLSLLDSSGITGSLTGRVRVSPESRNQSLAHDVLGQMPGMPGTVPTLLNMSPLAWSLRCLGLLTSLGQEIFQCDNMRSFLSLSRILRIAGIMGECP